MDRPTFDALTETAYDSLPETFRSMCDNVVIQTPDWPPDETLDHFGIESPYGLLGLYSGISLDRKTTLDPAPMPDMVFLYREPILAYAEERGEEIEAVIRHVLIHEIGHHFGLSDDDMEAIEAAAG